MPTPERLAEQFEAHRGHLRAVAYRMLGSASEAEDAVQESWIRLGRTDVDGVGNLRAWLTTVVARVCPDMLRTRTSRREETAACFPCSASRLPAGRSSRSISWLIPSVSADSICRPSKAERLCLLRVSSGVVHIDRPGVIAEAREGLVRATLQHVRASRADGTAIQKPPPPELVERSVNRVLEETSLCAWSTVTGDGKAHVNIGYFAYSDQLEFFLLSHPNSLHCRNIEANDSMAVAVFASTQHWTDPGRGIQFFGACTRTSGGDAARAERIYGQRFSAFLEWKAAIRPIDAGYGYRLYRFVAERLKILDEPEFGDAVFVEADILGGTNT